LDSIDEIINTLSEFDELAFGNFRLEKNAPLSAYTSFRIGGNAEYMLFPQTKNALIVEIRVFRGFGLPFEIIGNGTNVLAAEKLETRIIINTSEIKDEIKLIGNDVISVSCGISLAKIASFAYENSLTGFEFAQGIPGTFGGAVIMNAGAYGSEMKDVISSVRVIDGTEIKTLNSEECGFAYRTSNIQREKMVVVSGEIKLKAGNADDISTLMREYARRRREKQPLDMPSAGSAFKRPVGAYAAALIDECGLKGYTVGGAMVSEKHAGFVVNKGNASFSDVISVMDHVRRVVKEKTGYELEPELKILS